MSLILEALRKLDREKQVPERGFLVMAPAAWSSQEGPRWRWAWLVLAGVALGIGALLLAGRAPRARMAETPQPVSAPAAPAPTPVPQEAAPVQARPPIASMAAPPAGPIAAAPTTSEPAQAAAKAGTFVLQAITERDGQPLALINDRMLREGDEIDGARIVKIGDTFVEIEYQGRSSALRF